MRGTRKKMYATDMQTQTRCRKQSAHRDVYTYTSTYICSVGERNVKLSEIAAAAAAAAATTIMTTTRWSNV